MVRVLSGVADYRPRKVLALEYVRNIVDTPSEFLENRRFYRFLIVAAAECDVLVFLQDATRTTSQLPPGFAATFRRRVLGVVTKIDLPGARPDLARRFLARAGVKDILEINLTTEEGRRALRERVAGSGPCVKRSQARTD